MSDWTWEYVPDAANVVGGLTPAQIDEVESASGPGRPGGCGFAAVSLRSAEGS